MTKKHFIALADTMKQINIFDKPCKETVIAFLADFCASQNPRFNRERWLGYINGTNGPNGEKVKP